MEALELSPLCPEAFHFRPAHIPTGIHLAADGSFAHASWRFALQSFTCAPQVKERFSDNSARQPGHWWTGATSAVSSLGATAAALPSLGVPALPLLGPSLAVAAELWRQASRVLLRELRRLLLLRLPLSSAAAGRGFQHPSLLPLLLCWA